MLIRCAKDFTLRMADRDSKTWEVEVPITLAGQKVSATFGLFWTLPVTDDQLIVKYEGNTLETFTGPCASNIPRSPSLVALLALVLLPLVVA